MNLTKKILFLLIGALSSLLVGMTILELFFGSWIFEDKWENSKSLNIIRNRKTIYSTENIYGSSLPSVVYTRDSNGLRGDCKSTSEIKILTVGGSTTDQRMVPDGMTYQDVLQEKIKSELKRDDICVSNAGVDGHSTFGHLASFDYWYPNINNLNPKYFLFYIGINDARFRDKPVSRFDNLKRDDESVIWETIRQKSAFWSLAKSIRDLSLQLNSKNVGHLSSIPSESDYVVEQPSVESKELISANSKLFAQRLQLLLLKVKQFGAIPICVSQPHLFTIKTNGHRLGVREAFNHNGVIFNGIDFDNSINSLNEVMKVQCVNMGGVYIDLANKKFERNDFYDLMHMNYRGVLKIGEYLFGEFNQNGVIKNLD